MDALREAGGDRNAVAKCLGISRATVWPELKRYELNWEGVCLATWTSPAQQPS